MAPGHTSPAAISGIFRKLRIVPVAINNRLLEVRMKGRFLGGEKAGPEQDALGSQSESRDEAAPICKAARRKNRNRRNRVDHHGDERHARHPSDVTATFGALGDDDIGSGFRSACRLADRARHMRDLAARVVRAGKVGPQILLGEGPGELHHARLELKSHCEAVFTDIEQKEIEAEWLISFAANSRGAFADLLGRLIMAP